MPYGGNFSTVGGFSFFGYNDFGGGVNSSAVMPYGGNFSAIGGFSFFGGGGKTKIWR